MEGFDTMNMPHLASTISLEQVSVSGYMNSLPTLGIHDQSSGFDASNYIGNELGSFIPSALSYDAMRRYSTMPEDTFSETTSQHDPLLQDQSVQEPPSIERNNKLLRFDPPKDNFILLDYSFRQVSPSLTAQLQGSNFFLAESPLATSGETSVAPPELTCYRRNIFQIVGSITLPRTMRYIVTDRGDRIPIQAQELSISATESVEGNPVKIITVPWKTSTVTSVPEEKMETEPAPIPLDIITKQDPDPDYATFPIAWKRLQFRVATANNGRRKELQQHFIIQLKVIATLKAGSKVSICETRSCPIIVRGRSPRNFQQRKDLALTGTGSSMRKAMHPPSLLTRTSSGDSLPRPMRFKAEPSPETPLDNFQYSPPPNPQNASPHNFIDWTQIPHGAPSSLTALPNPTFTTTASLTISLPAYAHSSPDLTRHSTMTSHPSPSLPLPLSLIDSPPPPTKRARLFKKNPRRTSQPPTSTSKISYNFPTSSPNNRQRRPHSNPLPVPMLQTRLSNDSGSGSGSDADDLLYEYFPMGLDDWMPPVDAVYRPHVLHHTNLPREVGGSGMAVMAGRVKRMYSECEA
ncbi:hypothetical protein MMC08_008977 [Hypocenomyce scalaris]|nr:hypothetical protein [Hypocenomyce scalaris]